jgi:thioredoxin-dependent peroxiredoxin
VVGISADTVESHHKFAQKHRLSFTLLADPTGTVAQAYGVRINILGKIISKRVTFLIDRDGTVAKVWNPASTTKHAEAVLAGAAELGLAKTVGEASAEDAAR